ncbi:MAG: hypothetical protein GEU98_05850 [Pseudonocardiaceae bacterium]|nr:hypothetical protein [Pseudonocardiaceae bacterium]
MSDLSTRPWVRWQDWGEVVFGIVVALSPLWFDTSTAALWTMVVLGALVALDGIASLAMPGMVYSEWIQMVLGVLLFISPWVMSYTEMTGAAWTSWIGGVLIVLAGAAALPAANTAHQRAAGQH